MNKQQQKTKLNEIAGKRLKFNYQSTPSRNNPRIPHPNKLAIIIYFINDPPLKGHVNAETSGLSSCRLTV